MVTPSPGRAWGRIDPSPSTWRATRSDHWITGVGSPAHRLVELEVRLGLGDRIEQRNRLCFLFPCWWVSCDQAANAQAMDGLGRHASEAGLRSAVKVACTVLRGGVAATSPCYPTGLSVPWYSKKRRNLLNSTEFCAHRLICSNLQKYFVIFLLLILDMSE